MSNWLASCALTFGSQLLAWGIVDYENVRRFGQFEYPFPLNPWMPLLTGIAISGFGLCAFAPRFSFMRAAGIATSVFLAFDFWFYRRLTGPYTDYGADHFVQLVTRWFYASLIFVPVAVGENYCLKQKGNRNETEPTGDGKRD